MIRSASNAVSWLPVTMSALRPTVLLQQTQEDRKLNTLRSGRYVDIEDRDSAYARFGGFLHLFRDMTLQNAHRASQFRLASLGAHWFGLVQNAFAAILPEQGCN